MIKKIILFACTFIFTASCFAQADQTIFGINPNTTMKKFNKSLLAKGYKPSQTAKGRYEYKVTYAGYQNCTMMVKYNNGNDSITLINIYFPHESYAKDKAIFQDMTAQFKAKYGNESTALEELSLLMNRKNRVRSYGYRKINECYVSWYCDDDEEEDGVHVQYITAARPEYDNDKITPSSDI